MTLAAITATGLSKAYGDKVVLDAIDLSVPAGTVFALLGPNGAGKTTTVRILSTLVPAVGGELRVAGFDVRREAAAVRCAIGVTGQFSAVDDLLTGEENLLLMADLLHLDRAAGRRRAAELLEQLDLTAAGRLMAATYSGGMKRRLDLAMTLVGVPQVIFLDEPTTGLDPRSRRALWSMVRDLVRGGVTVLLTTQYLEEADHLADTIAVLDRGRIVAQGTSEQLKRLVPGGHVRLHLADAATLEQVTGALGGTADLESLTVDVQHDGSLRSLRELLARLDQTRVEVTGLSVHTPDLDDVFLSLTGQEVAR